MPDTDHDQATPSENDEPVEPIDRMIAGLSMWLDDAEAKLEQVTEEARVPDDIPRFVTRYQP